MHKNLFLISGLFALGLLVGIVIMIARDDEQPVQATGAPVVSVEQPSSSPWEVIHGPESSDNNQLEDKISELEARISVLEQVAASPYETITKVVPSTANTRDSRLNRTLTVKSLVKAGLSEDIAAEIVRRRNDIELRKLELSDRASREGYVGTPRFVAELTALVDEQLTLREELGDDAYDEYLFANGQTNRVKVASVMLGSTAEEAGMKDGDMILTYGENRIFEGYELKNATSEGELGDYVNIDILRDGQLMSLWVPRGPLGVRLGIARAKP